MKQNGPNLQLKTFGMYYREIKIIGLCETINGTLIVLDDSFVSICESKNVVLVV
tara:strand:+ start:255 stop:416 length:162 start_codon:yes stop_codon:yes gene_type:complete